MCIFFPSCLYGAVIEKEYFSIDLPDGWVVANETEQHLLIVSPLEEGINVSLEINTYNISRSLEDILLELVRKPFQDAGIKIGKEVQTKEGYCIMRIETLPGGFILAGLKDNHFDSVLIFGFHSELKNVLQSFRLLEKRPYLLEMSKFALSIVDRAMEIKQ
jgi:hypothetical protein